jgi:hypothetical protein
MAFLPVEKDLEMIIQNVVKICPHLSIVMCAVYSTGAGNYLICSTAGSTEI